MTKNKIERLMHDTQRRGQLFAYFVHGRITEAEYRDAAALAGESADAIDFLVALHKGEKLQRKES